MIEHCKLTMVARSEIEDRVCIIRNNFEVAFLESLCIRYRIRSVHNMKISKGAIGRVVAKATGIITTNEVEKLANFNNCVATNFTSRAANLESDFYIYIVGDEYLLVDAVRYLKYLWEFK